jgi:hypothetical protein
LSIFVLLILLDHFTLDQVYDLEPIILVAPCIPSVLGLWQGGVRINKVVPATGRVIVVTCEQCEHLSILHPRKLAVVDPCIHHGLHVVEVTGPVVISIATIGLPKVHDPIVVHHVPGSGTLVCHGLNLSILTQHLFKLAYPIALRAATE